MSCSNLHSRRTNIPFQKVDPISRMTYVVTANIAIGTVLSAIAIQYLLKAQFVKPEQLRLNKPRLRTAASIIASAAGGGLALFMLQNPRTADQLLYLTRLCKSCQSQ